MRAFGCTHPKCPHQTLNDLAAHLNVARLLEPGIPSEADPGELRQLFSTKAWGASSRPRLEAERDWIGGFAAGAEEGSEFVTLIGTRHLLPFGPSNIYTSLKGFLHYAKKCILAREIREKFRVENMGADRANEKITTAFGQRRAKAVKQVLASSRLEGARNSEAFLSNVDRYVSGEITTEELRKSAGY